MSGQNFESEDMYLLIISGPIFTVKKMMISYDPQGWKESIPSGCDLTPKKDASIAEEEDSEDLSHEACGNMNQHGHPKNWG